MLSDLEKSLINIIDVFHQYSLQRGNKHAIYKNEMQKLLNNECPQYMKNKKAETVFKELDVNEDNGVNFEEFLVLIMKMGVAGHEDSHKK